MNPPDDTTPADGLRLDPTEAALGEIVRGQAANTRALGVIGRDIEALKIDIANIAKKALAVSDTTDRVTEEFARLHGIIQGLEHAEAEERLKMHADIRKTLSAVLKLTERMTPLESRVAGAELQLSLRDDNGR